MSAAAGSSGGPAAASSACAPHGTLAETTSSVERMLPQERITWQRLETTGSTKPSPRAAHSADMLPDGIRMVVFGGWDGRGAMNDVFVLDTLSMEWSQPEISGNLPPRRNNHASAMVGHELYVHAGHTGSEWLSDLYILNTENWRWREAQVPLPKLCRACHTMCYCGDSKLYIFGGFNGTVCFKSLEIVNIEDEILRKVSNNDTRTSSSTSGSSMRLSSSSAAAGSSPLVSESGAGIVGFLTSGNSVPETNEFCSQPSKHRAHHQPPFVKGEPPRARNAHSMSVVGRYLVLFGGHSGTSLLTDLHVFDTEKRAWIENVRVYGVPPPGMRGHSCSRVGDNHLLTFGGFDGARRHNEVSLLKIDRNRLIFRWLAAVETDDDSSAPSGRQRHTAVPLGDGRRSILIFGGFDGTRWLDDVYKLNIECLLDTQLCISITHMVSDFTQLLLSGSLSDVRFIVFDDSGAATDDDGSAQHETTAAAAGGGGGGGGLKVCNDEKDVSEPCFHEFKAHKCILAARCEYFKRMFLSNMRETSSNIIEIQDVSVQEFRLLLEYIYTGRVNTQQCTMLMKLMKVADKYSMANLKNLVSRYLEDKFHVGNVCDILRVADSCQSFDLVDSCKRYIIQNANDVARSKGFEDLATTPWLLMDITRMTLDKGRQQTTTSSHAAAAAVVVDEEEEETRGQKNEFS